MLLVLNSAVACASKSLILKTQDDTFMQSERRLIQTIQQVDQLKPTEAERALFLQAEGLYDYRYDFPSRSVWSSLAEVAAAVSDFPAFQSMSGMLDLHSFRLKTYDGAVHLWETLLHHHPETPLRPLTLYRLGWAYRSTSVEGLPHHSGDEAFDQLQQDYPNSPLSALAMEAKAVPWKSKRTAAAYSFVPGIGQMYVGEYGDGVARLGIALASLAMVVTPSYMVVQRQQDLSWGRDWPLLGIGMVGLIALSLDYTAAFQDSMQEVVEFNERNENAFGELHPLAP